MKGKSKNKSTNLLVEVFFTLVVAALLSCVVAVAAVLILSYFDLSKDTVWSYVNYVSGALFGLVTGYKLKSLFEERKK